MIVISQFEIVYSVEREQYTIKSKEPPFCPLCNALMSGYDTRERHCIDETGQIIIDEGGGVLLMGKNDALHFLSFEIQRLLTDFVYSYFGVGENEEDEK